MNRGPLVSEATAVPTEPQPLPHLLIVTGIGVLITNTVTQVGFEPTTLEDTEPRKSFSKKSLIASVSCTEVRAGGYQTWVIEFVLQ